MSKSCYFR
jgi:VIT1/CCC1 family predicted Fe2+/Mn2+ transporter